MSRGIHPPDPRRKAAGGCRPALRGAPADRGEATTTTSTLKMDLDRLHPALQESWKGRRGAGGFLAGLLTGLLLMYIFSLNTIEREKVRMLSRHVQLVEEIKGKDCAQAYHALASVEPKVEPPSERSCRKYVVKAETKAELQCKNHVQRARDTHELRAEQRTKSAFRESESAIRDAEGARDMAIKDRETLADELDRTRGELERKTVALDTCTLVYGNATSDLNTEVAHLTEQARAAQLEVVVLHDTVCQMCSYMQAGRQFPKCAICQVSARFGPGMGDDVDSDD